MSQLVRRAVRAAQPPPSVHVSPSPRLSDNGLSHDWCHAPCLVPERRPQVLDGFARFTELGSTRTAGGVGPPVCHVFGNHEASSVPRSELVPMLRLPASEHIPTEQGAAYYDVRFGPSTPQNNYGGCAPELLPAAGIHEAGPSSPPTVRLVALDTYDVSTAGWPEGHPKRAAAAAMLATGRAAREEPFLDHPELNGGVGPEQLAWLETVLADAAAVGEMVVVFSHAPLYPPVSMDGYAVCWNHAEVRAVLRDAGPTVVLCLSGHDHEGAMRVEWVPAGDPTHAICHLCLEAALEAPVGEECHGVLEIFEDKLIVRGAGGVKDRYMQIWRKDRSPPASDAPDAPDAAAASQSQ